MRQVRAILEIPRDYAYSNLVDYQYLYPKEALHNYNVVCEMFITIDSSLVDALKREVKL